jgi:poly(3-hydroxyalkanoate) synthetase
LAPSNFLATNPEVLSKTIETGGENLLSGLTNLLHDLQRGKGRLSITRQRSHLVVRRRQLPARQGAGSI